MIDGPIRVTTEKPPDQGVTDSLALIAAMSQDFARSLDVDATLRNALHRIMQYLDAEAASVFLLDPVSRDIFCQVCVGGSDITGIRLAFGQGIVGQSIADQTSMIVRNARAHPQFASKIDETTGFTTRSLICAPMSVQGRALGAIELVNKKGGDGLFGEADRRMLETLASSAAMALSNAEMTRQLIAQQRFQRELELAAEMQRSLLPAPKSGAFPVHGINLPARIVSGDFFDHLELADGRISFALGDVAGKGINAALMMAKVSAAFRCLTRACPDPGALLALIDHELRDNNRRGMFVTMIVGLYDHRTQTLRLANAGHEPPLLREADGRFVDCEEAGMPLGLPPALTEPSVFQETEFNMSGRSLYLFSDGVTEWRMDRSVMLGRDGLIRVLNSLSAEAPPERLARIANAVRGAAEPPHDDFTLMVVEERRQRARKDQA